MSLWQLHDWPNAVVEDLIYDLTDSVRRLCVAASAFYTFDEGSWGAGSACAVQRLLEWVLWVR